MNNCLNCEKELVHTPGRRQKKYCGEKCRVTHYQKEHKQQSVSLKSFQELKKKFDEVVIERNEFEQRLFELLGGEKLDGKKHQMFKDIVILGAARTDGQPMTIEDINVVAEIKSNEIKPKPIEAPKKENVTKPLPPVTRNEPAAHKQATEELAKILDKKPTPPADLKGIDLAIWKSENWK